MPINSSTRPNYQGSGHGGGVNTGGGVSGGVSVGGGPGGSGWTGGGNVSSGGGGYQGGDSYNGGYYDGGDGSYQTFYDEEAAAAAQAAAEAAAAQARWEAEQETARRQADLERAQEEQAKREQKRNQEAAKPQAQAAIMRQAQPQQRQAASQQQQQQTSRRPDSGFVERQFQETAGARAAQTDIQPELKSLAMTRNNDNVAPQRVQNETQTQEQPTEEQRPQGRPGRPRMNTAIQRGRYYRRLQEQRAAMNAMASGYNEQGRQAVAEEIVQERPDIPQHSEAQGEPERTRSRRPRFVFGRGGESSSPSVEREGSEVVSPSYAEERAERTSVGSIAQEQDDIAVDVAINEDQAADNNENVVTGEPSQANEVSDENIIEEIKDEIFTPENAAEQAQRRIDNINGIIDWFDDAYYTYSGDWVNKETGETGHSDELNEAFTTVFKDLGCDAKDEGMVAKAALQLFGVTIDSNELLFKKDDFVIKDEMMIDALNTLHKNIIGDSPVLGLRANGQPFAYSWQVKGKSWASSERFPLPMTVDVAQFLAKDRPGNKIKRSASDIFWFSYDQYQRIVAPAVNLYAEPKQKFVIANALDAIEQINNTREALSGRTGNPYLDGDRVAADIFNPASVENSQLSPEARELLLKANDSHMRAYSNYQRRMAKIADKLDVGPNGDMPLIDKVKYGEPSLPKTIVDVLQSIHLLSPAIAVGAAVQAPFQTLENRLSIVAQSLLQEFRSQNRGNIRDTGTDRSKAEIFFEGLKGSHSSAETYRVARQSEVVSVINGYLGALGTGNREMIVLSAQRNKGKADGKSRMSDVAKQMDEIKDPTLKSKIYQGCGALKGFAYRVASGDVILQGSTINQFIDALMLNAERTPGVNMSREELEAIFRNDPIGFIDEMIIAGPAMDALNLAATRTLQKNDFLDEMFIRFMERNAITKLLVMGFCGNFPVYGFKWFKNMLPFSRTMNLLLNAGAMNLAPEWAEQNNIQDTSVVGRIYMNEGFREALYVALAQDAIICGSRTAMLLIAMGVLSALGFEPPDDDELRMTWGEWKIAGVPMELNWYLADATGIMWPLAMAIMSTKVENPNTPAQAVGLFESGVKRLLTSNPLYKLSSLGTFMNNWDELNFTTQEALDYEFNAQYDQLFNGFLEGMPTLDQLKAEHPEYAEELANHNSDSLDDLLDAYSIVAEHMAREWLESNKPTGVEMWKVQLETFGVSWLSQMLQVPLLNDLYNMTGALGTQGLAVSTNRIYNPNGEEGDDFTVATTYEDSQIRRITNRNYVAAGFMNLIQAIAGNDDVRQTGYLHGQMPVQVHESVNSRACEQKYGVSNAMTDAQRTEQVLKAIEDVEWFYNKYGTAAPERMVANGMHIPKDTAQLIVDFAQAKINEAENKKTQELAKLYSFGYSYAQEKVEQNNIWDEYNQATDYWYRIRGWFMNGDVPNQRDMYNVYDNEYRIVYRNESGQPISALDAMLNPNSTSDYYESGVHRNSYVPIKMVPDYHNSFNYETPMSGYNPTMTSDEAMRYLFGDVRIVDGDDAGQNAYDILTADGMIYKDGHWMAKPVVGHRAWIPVNDYTSEWLLDPDRDDAWNPLGEMGKKGSAAASTPSYSRGGYGRSYGSRYYPRSYYPRSYGYSRSYGGGGSSYEYNPKIYSNPAYSLSADRPATMYSKIPYSTTFDYLNPNFETKGSREAYKRSDI